MVQFALLMEFGSAAYRISWNVEHWNGWHGNKMPSSGTSVATVEPHHLHILSIALCARCIRWKVRLRMRRVSTNFPASTCLLSFQYSAILASTQQHLARPCDSGLMKRARAERKREIVATFRFIYSLPQHFYLSVHWSNNTHTHVLLSGAQHCR